MLPLESRTTDWSFYDFDWSDRASPAYLGYLA
jgi:hypothetical protein